MIPGVATITKNSPRASAAWKFLLLTMEDKYQDRIAVASNSIPAYLSVIAGSPKWSGPEYQFIVEQSTRAFPVQYPRSTFYQFGELESTKPIRAMLMEIIYKNITAEQASSRVCDMIDEIMLPECDSTFWEFTVGTCDASTLTRSIVYKWKTPKLCRKGITALPDTIVVDCAFVPSNSGVVSGFKYRLHRLWQ
jgi:hypothetical protein